MTARPFISDRHGSRSVAVRRRAAFGAWGGACVGMPLCRCVVADAARRVSWVCAPGRRSAVMQRWCGAALQCSGRHPDRRALALMTAGRLCHWGASTSALPSYARQRGGVESERRKGAVGHGAPGGVGKASRYVGMSLCRRVVAVVREGGLCSSAGRCAVADQGVGARV